MICLKEVSAFLVSYVLDLSFEVQTEGESAIANRTGRNRNGEPDRSHCIG